MSIPQILIVEDEGIIAKDLQTRLKNFGYNVPLITASGEDAIKQTENIKPDLILMDIVLKGEMSGIEAAEHIQRCFHIPVVFISAYTDEETIKNAKFTEPFGYLIKPFDDAELSVTIKMALHKHEMEQKLKKSKERYRSIVENTSDIVITFSPQGNILSLNPTLVKLTKWPIDYWIGKHFSLIIHPDDSSIFLENFKLTLNRKPSSPFEIRLRLKSGEYKSFELVTVPETQQGDVIRVLGVARDITERILIKKNMREEENRRRKFLETIDHELRTPLTSIKGFLEFLHNHYATLPQVQKDRCYKLISKNITFLELLLNDISSISKLERGAFKLCKRPINFRKFLNEELKSYKILLKNQFEYYIDDKLLPWVNLDENHFRQVLTNIINNSIKHTARDSRKIIMRVEADRRVLRIEISDNGAGIASENLEVIFKPFVTIPTKFSSEGTGIGLNLSQRITSMHGGRLTAHSKGLNCGATFKIELPIYTFKDEESFNDSESYNKDKLVEPDSFH